VRGKLEIDLCDRTNLLLTADWSKQDRDCCAVVPVIKGTSAAYAFDWQDITIGRRNDEAPFGTKFMSNTKTDGISAELNIDFEKFVLTSITAYRGFELKGQIDADMIPYTEPTYARRLFTSNGTSGINPGTQEQTQFSEELRIATNSDGAVDLTAGLFYWDLSVDRYFERQVMVCNDPVEDPANLSYDPTLTPCNDALIAFGYMNSNVTTKNWAAFGQASWQLADDWTATLGLRYTQDDVSFWINRESPQPGPAVAPSFSGSNSTDESNLSGKLSVQWNFGDNVMLYGSYAEGYKAPGFDRIFLTGANRLNPVPAETSQAWEMGMKGEFDRLRFGLTAFHTTFHDLQSRGTRPDDVGFFLVSAGEAITQGIELDITAKPMPNLLLNGGLAWVDAHFQDYSNAPCYSGQTSAEGCIGGVQDVSGKDIPNSPDLKASFQAPYDIELTAPFDMFATGNYRWQSESAGNLNQDPLLDHDSYGIFDLTVGVEADSGRWSAQIFAKNLFDTFYEDLRTSNNIFDPGGVAHYLARDSRRYVGVQFEAHFGGS